MSEIDRFRIESSQDLDPSFMSLGLPSRAFRDGATDDRPGFDAALNGLPPVGIPGEVPQSALFLFKGSTFFLYDLLTDRITSGPVPLEQLFFGTLPPAFRLGIDAATWAGPGIANLAYAFRGSEYVRANMDVGWCVDTGPSSSEVFLTTPTGEDTYDFTIMGHSCIIYGIRNSANRLHFFGRNGFYARHNLENGQMDVAPVPISEAWPLPSTFGNRVDLAFYGAGQEAEHLFLFSGPNYAQWDARTETLFRTGVIDERFPALAVLMPRPQLFLVENYALETYVGPLRLGSLVDTVSVPAGGTISRVVVTRITTAASKTLRQNMLESQSADTARDFSTKLDEKQESEEEAESYAYRLRALFHGEAQATSVWGGEVDADLQVAGGSDSERQRLVESTFSSLATQVRETTHTVNQSSLDIAQAEQMTTDVFNKETFEMTNPTGDTRQVEYFALRQPYVAMLVLKGVKAAYTDGTRPPQVFFLNELPDQLAEVLSDPGAAGPLLDYVASELQRIVDIDGQRRSILDAGALPNLQVDPRVRSTFAFLGMDQTIELAGIIKGAKEFLQPTYRSRPIDQMQDLSSTSPAAMTVLLSSILDPVSPSD